MRFSAADNIRHYAESAGLTMRHYAERGVTAIRHYAESARLVIRNYAERGVATVVTMRNQPLTKRYHSEYNLWWIRHYTFLIMQYQRFAVLCKYGIIRFSLCRVARIVGLCIFGIMSFSMFLLYVDIQLTPLNILRFYKWRICVTIRFLVCCLYGIVHLQSQPLTLDFIQICCFECHVAVNLNTIDRITSFDVTLFISYQGRWLPEKRMSWLTILRNTCAVNISFTWNETITLNSSFPYINHQLSFRNEYFDLEEFQSTIQRFLAPRLIFAWANLENRRNGRQMNCKTQNLWDPKTMSIGVRASNNENSHSENAIILLELLKWKT